MKTISLFFIQLTLLLLAAQLIGCQQFINDKPKENDRMSLDGEQNSELQQKLDKSQQTIEVIEQLLAGEENQQEVENIFNANSSILEYFIENTRGQSTDSYTPDEIRSFLHKYVLVENGQLKYEIDDDLLDQAMTFKTVILGGTTQLITDGEIQKMIELIQLIKRLLVENREALSVTYNSILSYQKMNADKIELSLKQLESPLIELGKFVEPHAAEYSFAQFFTLVAKSYSFVKYNPPQWLNQATEYLPLIELVKTIFIGGERSKISAGEWQLILPSLPRGLSLYFQIEHKLTNLSKLDRVALENLDSIVEQTISHLNAGLSRRNDPSLLFEEIDEVLNHTFKVNPYYKTYIADPVNEICERVFYQNRFLKSYCADEKSVRNLFFKTYRKVLARFSGKSGLSIADINRLKTFYRSWSVTQQSIDLQFAANKALKTSTFKSDFRRFFRSLELETELKSSLERMSDVFIVRRPPEILPSGKVLVSNPTLKQINRNGATTLNLIKTAVELVFRTYATAQDKSLDGITEGELNQFYLDTRELMLLLGMFDWRTETAGKRMFLEGQIFTYASNGDEKLEIDEAIELVANLYSSGFITSGKLRKEFTNKCSIENTKGGFGWPRLNKSCVRSEMFSVLERELDNMPRLKTDLLSMKKQDLDFTFDTLLKMSHGALSCQSSYESADIQKLIVLLTYAEIIFTKYDTNFDERLDKSEIDKAFPTIKGVMESTVPVGFWASVATFGKTRALRNGLYFVLEKNRLPETAVDYATIVEWSWTGHEIEPITRKKLLFLFDIVLGSLEGPATNQISPNESCL